MYNGQLHRLCRRHRTSLPSRAANDIQAPLSPSHHDHSRLQKEDGFPITTSPPEASAEVQARPRLLPGAVAGCYTAVGGFLRSIHLAMARFSRMQRELRLKVMAINFFRHAKSSSMKGRRHCVLTGVNRESVDASIPELLTRRILLSWLSGWWALGHPGN
jgi:hypothetical protein